MTFTLPIGFNPVALCKIAWMDRLQKQFAFLGGVERGSRDGEGPDSEREREHKRTKLKEEIAEKLRHTETELKGLTNRKAKKE